MSAANLRVLVASADRLILRQSALLLNQFGYEAVCCADVSTALATIGSLDCDFLIVDHDSLDGDFAPIEFAKRRRNMDHVHLYLLCEDFHEVDIDAAIESGVDDFLKKPLSNGEVLARLRAGARYCEFQRRSCRQRWRDPLTGLATRAALWQHLEKQLPQRGRSRRLALAVLELDLFQSVAATYGNDVSNEAECSVARAMDEACTAGQIAVRLGPGRYAVLLPDHSAEKAAKWTEQLRRSIGELEIAFLESDHPITASAGVVAADDVVAPAELLDLAEAALKEAQDSGRNTLATGGQFVDERTAWSELMQSGNPFRSTLARDVMTPLTLQLHAEDSLPSACALHAQSKLDWLPVVDQRGSLTGMLECRRLADWEGQEDAAPAISELMSRDFAQLDDSATFNAVMDCFIQQEEPALVITREGRADGFIAREQFLALVRPISADMFRRDERDVRSTDFLVVPDVVAV